MGNQAKLIINLPHDEVMYSSHLKPGDVVYVQMEVVTPDICGDVFLRCDSGDECDYYEIHNSKVYMLTGDN